MGDELAPIPTPPSNVRRFPQRRAVRPIPLGTAHIGPTCLHSRTEVDESARKVRCATCRADLDPIHVLAVLAREVDAWAHLHAAKRALGKACEELKAEVQRLKAAKRRAL